MREPDLTRGTKLYVPAHGSFYRASIREGSGIVGTPVPGMGRVEIYYEGAIYGQVNIATFEDRVYHAWDRCVTQYPTVATAVPKASELIEVGDVLAHVRDEHNRPTLVITNQAALDEWLGRYAAAPDETVVDAMRDAGLDI